MNSAAIMSNGMPRDTIDTEGENSDLEDRIDRSLPGVNRGKDATSRTITPAVRVTSAQFAPTGRSFCVASTEGLLVYSLDNTGMEDFDPFDLDIDVTPQNIKAMLSVAEPEYLKALVMSFRLNDKSLIQQVYESIPPTSTPLVIRELPRVYLPRLLRFLGEQLEATPHLEFHLLWVTELIGVHGRYIKEHQGEFVSELRAVLKGVEGVGKTVRTLSERNGFEIDFLTMRNKATGVKALENGHTGEENAMLLDGDEAFADSEEAGDWMGVE